MQMLETVWTEIVTFFRLIQVQDIIDIVIVAFVIYQVIRLVRETRAAQLVKGILILLVVMQLSSWLNFNVLKYILQNTMQFGLLALMVVFQPELRRALEEVGRSRFSRIFDGGETREETKIEREIEEVARAAETLAANRTGALMVLERKTMLGEIIKTGIALNSDVSAELLLNIFVPNTALHDGAAIIRDGQIMAAGCFLPLSQNASLSKELGTRHRAAVGVSENSDAVVVVVSEETGHISIALNGSLTRNVTIDNLKRALHKTLMPEEKEPARKRLAFWKKRKEGAQK